MYGFAADPQLTKWENAKNRLSNMMIQQYFSNISNTFFPLQEIVRRTTYQQIVYIPYQSTKK